MIHGMFYQSRLRPVCKPQEVNILCKSWVFHTTSLEQLTAITMYHTNTEVVPNNTQEEIPGCVSCVR